MPVIEISTAIHAPIERVFDMARSVDAHVASCSSSRESVIDSDCKLLELGHEVTFRAKHFGLWQQLTSRITVYERPTRFRDSMVSGLFARFDHDHLFEASAGTTVMTDIFDYSAPWGGIGRLADTLFLRRYMIRILRERAGFLKSLGESERWREFLDTWERPHQSVINEEIENYR